VHAESERLGHATSAFTLQVYSHVIPGMDEAAASSVAALILTAGNDVGSGVSDTNGRISGRRNVEPQAEKALTRAKAQVSGGSGGSVLVQDIGDRCLKT
jgi:hypothetical protein